MRRISTPTARLLRNTGLQKSKVKMCLLIKSAAAQLCLLHGSHV
jgi:hypothetical protein